MINNVGIEIRDLSKNFGKVTALDRLSLHIEEGLLHGIIGPDGAGKTTLMRLLDGLLTPSHGTIAFSQNGQPLTFEDLRPSLAYMPSKPSLYPDLSIAEHMAFFKDLYQLPDNVFRDRAKELLSITRLDKFKDRKAGQLSGGMYKKLGLMCALLQSPSALLLDEPTNGVDPISRREFWELLYGLAAEKVLILISTAYMDEAERCTRVHLLESGRLIATGDPAALLAQEGVKTFDEIFLRTARS